MPIPPFANGKRWVRRASHAKSIDRRVFYDPETGFEYERDPAKNTFHEIDPHRDRYRDIDPDTGLPVWGGEGQWRPLR